MTQAIDVPVFLPDLLGWEFASGELPIYLPTLTSMQAFAAATTDWYDGNIYGGAYWGAPAELFFQLSSTSATTGVEARLPAIGEFSIGQETDANFPLLIMIGDSLAEFASTTDFADLIESGRAKLSVNIEMKVRAI